MTTTAQGRHRAWLSRVVDDLSRNGDVVGLVAFGSTAASSRVDEWSDHDIAIVTLPGSQERYRDGAAWLPDPEHLVVRTVEHHGGGKAMYANGHLVEWGVDTVAGLRDWLADDYQVLVDRGGVATAMAHAAAQRTPALEVDFDRDRELFVFHIMHGMGRFSRGEVLSASAVVKGEAAATLVKMAHSSLPSHAPGSRDRLDPLRRAELAFPFLATEINQACALPVDECARALLVVAITHFGVSPRGIRPEQLAALTDRLNWPDVQPGL